jgi:sugar lactone lactonase YvrE
VPACLPACRRGKLIAYHPHTGSAHVLLNDLRYPDGVALSPDESYMLMVETDRIRVLKFWLEGDKVRKQCAVLVLLQY